MDTESTASQASSDEPAEEVIWKVGTTASRPYRAVLEVNGHPLTMEIDTGAAVSLISKTTQENLFPATRLDKSSLILRTYTAEIIPILGRKCGFTTCEKVLAGFLELLLEYKVRCHTRVQVASGAV